MRCDNEIDDVDQISGAYGKEVGFLGEIFLDPLLQTFQPPLDLKRPTTKW